jgi:hypothetical protein
MISIIRKNARIVPVLVILLYANICSASLSDALDTTLIFSTGGDAGWIQLFSIVDYNGDIGDAARSGYIEHNQESWMQTTVTGSGTLSFYWAVSSQGNYDFLEFYIDSSRQNRISGLVDWQQMSYTIPSGSHILKWRYVKNESQNIGSDCGFVDKVEWTPSSGPPSGLLPEALDTTLTFGTGGDAEWYDQSLISFYDGDAAQSGYINDDQESWMETSVTGPGALSFYWKVSSEDDYDLLEFYIDNHRRNFISNERDWQQMNYALDSGSHHLIWRYVKDESVSYGSDCGWVDKVEWTPGGELPPTPGPTTEPISDALDTTLYVSTGGNANWFSQTETTYFGSDAAQSGYIFNYQNSWIQTSVTGPGTLSFYWKVSSENNYDYLEFYIDTSMQNHISGSVDWQQMSYSISSGPHTVVWRYIKDGSDYSGSDCGWVDKLEWTPSSEPPAPPPSSGSLAEAMDTTLDFTTTGSEVWFYQTITSYNDGDAAQSGQISDDQVSSMQTTVEGAGTFSFYWKVSSETNYDFLEFYIDSVRQHFISGSVDWQQKSYTISSGSHTLLWRYTKDGSANSGSDCGWVDKVEWSAGGEPPAPPQPPTPGSLADAMDTTLEFDVGGNAYWFNQTATFYYDGDAAQSGNISENQASWMQTTVTGPGTLSFYWNVSSETNFDFLEFYIDSSRQNRISGSVGADWQQKSFEIASGSHTLLWRYFKDESVNSGSDCGWVDKVEWTPSSEPPPPPPPSPGSLSDAMDTTLDFTTTGGAVWFNQTTTFYNDGDAAQSGHISDDQVSLMQTTVEGPGTFSFYWKVSSETNYDLLEFYIDGSRQNLITGSVDDWQQRSYTISSGPHTLLWRYTKDSSISLGSDCGWVDKVEWLPGEEPPAPQPSPELLSEALDTTLVFTTGGDIGWFNQTLMYYYDEDAAQSGPITDSQESWMQTTVTGPGTLTFYWYVSSETNFDFLEFYIDSSRQNRISGSTGANWQQKTYTISSGSHTLLWRYFKDGSVNSGNDCGWVDKVEWTPSNEPPTPPPPDPNSVSLPVALDTTLDIATGGNAEWFRQTTIYYYDEDAAQSGDISDNQESWMQSTVTGPGMLSFYWKVSSESDYDNLEFYIDSDRQLRISGTMNWQQQTYAIPSGAHILVWRYVKDSTIEAGSDCGWVDKVEWTPGALPPSEPVAFIYCAGPNVEKVWKLRKSDLAKIAESINYGGTIGAITEDDDYIYCAGYIGKVWKLRKSDLTKVAESPAYGGNIEALTEDNDYIYCGGVTTQKVWKLNKTDLSFVAESIGHGGNIYALVEDNNYIYCAGTNQRVWKLLKSDLSFVAQNSAPLGYLWALAQDSDYIYCAGNDQRVHKLQKSNLAQTAVSSYYGNYIEAVVVDTDYIYFSGYGTQKIWKLQKSDLVKIDESIDYGGSINALVIDTDYIYCGGEVTQTVWKLNKSDLAKVEESINYGGEIRVLTGEEEVPSPAPPSPSEPLSDALDTTLSIYTGGDADWFKQSTTYYYGADAAQSGPILYDQASWMQTTVTGPGTLSFYWNVSSETNFDFLEFYIDDIRQNRISSSLGPNWQQRSYTIPSGSHTLLWRYVKDGSVNEGYDCGWVDWVQFVSP